MAPPLVIQKSFSAGEWAPELNARVDLAKYHSAAATMRNFFVDYRGGASTRAGTKWILQAKVSSKAVRLIPFQASFTVNYVLEFGDFYIRFYTNGGPVLESAKTITAITNANPGAFTSVGHGYSTGDWIFIQSIVGMQGGSPATGFNNGYFIVQRIDADHYSVTDLFGTAVNTTTYSAYVSGGTTQRVYTLTSPYAAADLALVKFVQSVNTLILCHPSYPPQALTLVSATNWTISAIAFGPTISTPTGLGISSAVGGTGANTSYLYEVTAVDQNGQESSPVAHSQTGLPDIITARGSIALGWVAVPGAVYYNIYKATGYAGVGALPSGTSVGYIGFCTGTAFVDNGIAPDFSQTPPRSQNPFAGASVQSLTLTANANYTSVPEVTIAAPGTGVQATAYAYLNVVTAVVAAGGVAYTVGDILTLSNGVILQVATVGGALSVATVTIINAGSVSGTGNPTPTNPVACTGGTGTGATFTLTWHVGGLVLVSGGFGYTSTPAVTFSSGAATATATLGSVSAGNPSVPGFFDQRLVLASQPSALQTFYMSRPGAPYNFDTSNPVQADDSITGSIVSGKLNIIKSMLAAPTGLIMFTSQQAWLVNGGGANAAVTPIDITATGHAYNGANDVPPIQVNFDYLYIQSKGAIVRDLTFNFYTQIYTGTDISVLSSHLFYGYQILEWAWAEAPFSLVWAVRNDGVLLSLTFLKEQEIIGWAHHDTNGSFKSVASIPEAAQVVSGSTVSSTVDAVYVVVQRTVNSQTVQYIERMADRFPQDGYRACWAVDAGLQYSGSPATSFTGAQHLAGRAVVGLADGIPFSATISATGTFTLATAASLVTVGLAFTPQLQTLAIDVGDPTVQSKLKNIPFSSLRVRNTLGLSMGRNFSTLVAMKDLQLGAVNSMLTGLPAASQTVSDLYTGDARTFMDSAYTTQGQYCIQQDNPYYATVLGVIPGLTVGG